MTHTEIARKVYATHATNDPELWAYLRDTLDREGYTTGEIIERLERACSLLDDIMNALACRGA